MKKVKLVKEEQELLESYEKGEWVDVPGFGKRKKELMSYAKATVLKNKRVNIRVSQRDLELIQRRALEEGIPYQTLISSLLHKFVNGKLIEKGKGAGKR